MHESAFGDEAATVGEAGMTNTAGGSSQSGSSRTNAGAPRVPGTPMGSATMAVAVEAAPIVGSAVPPPNRSPRARQLSVSSASPSLAVPGSSRRGSAMFSFPWGRPKRQTSMEMQQAHAAAAAAATAAAATAAAITSPSTAAAAAAAPPRRRWFRYPVRVPILSLLLVSLLARTSEGWTSICGFLCGFLLFEGFSAPETGHPNRFDTLMRKCTNSIRACRKRRRKRAAGSLARRRMSAQVGLGSLAAHATQESFRKRIMGRLSSWIRSPFRACVACCRRRAKKHSATQAPRNSNTDSDDPASARPLLSENESGAEFPRSSPDDSAATAAAIEAAVAEEEESDVLLDVALSVTEDLEAPTTSASNAGGGDASAAGGAATSQTTDAPNTPLHPLTDLTDSSPLLLPSLPSLPTVSSLEPADLEDDPPSVSASGSGPGSADGTHASTNLGVTGGVVNFAHVSVSLRFTFRAYHIHLHHWLYLLIILLFLYMEQVWWKEHAASAPIYAFFSAFCLGGSVQGLKYADWSETHTELTRTRRAAEGRDRRSDDTADIVVVCCACAQVE